MKRIITLSIALFAITLSGLSQTAPKKKAGGPLDTKIYVIEIFKDGAEKKWNDEELKFMTGKLKSALFMDWGFSANAYEGTVIDSTAENIIVTFLCETKKNDKGEIMIWSGTVTGKDIEGNLELQSAKGKMMKSWTFTGTEKEKKVIKKK